MTKYFYHLSTKTNRIEETKNITQKEVADNMGIEQTVVPRMESGAHSPSLDMVERYAEAVGCRLKIEKKEEK